LRRRSSPSRKRPAAFSMADFAGIHARGSSRSALPSMAIPFMKCRRARRVLCSK
jgi:hypothetical protein